MGLPELRTPVYGSGEYDIQCVALAVILPEYWLPLHHRLLQGSSGIIGVKVTCTCSLSFSTFQVWPSSPPPPFYRYLWLVASSLAYWVQGCGFDPGRRGRPQCWRDKHCSHSLTSTWDAMPRTSCVAIWEGKIIRSLTLPCHPQSQFQGPVAVPGKLS